MKILFNNSNLYFSARKKEIRKADDIQRKANNRFNFISGSRIYDFYNDSAVIEHKIKAKELASKIINVTLATRYAAEAMEASKRGIDILYADDLDLSEYTGFGNCMEYAKAAMAALCANGYYNSERVNLRYEIKSINKKTGETEFKSEDTLDHSFVLTDLNCRKERDIVIDPWLNYADYKTEAKAEFKTLFKDKIKLIKEKHKKLFMIEKMMKNEEYRPEDYEIKENFVFAPREINATKFQKQKLGEYARNVYPELILNRRKDDIEDV